MCEAKVRTFEEAAIIFTNNQKHVELQLASSRVEEREERPGSVLESENVISSVQSEKAAAKPLLKVGEGTTLTNLPCDSCPRRFINQSGLRIHVKAAHSNDRPFACNQCSFRASYLAHLRKHEKRNHSGQHCCDLCPSTYSSIMSLAQHKMREHNIEPEKSYSCSVCRNRFTYKWNLQSHMAVHSGI